MLEVKEVQTLSEQEKTVSLFEFIKELNKLKQKVVLNIKDYPWHLAISDIPVFFRVHQCFLSRSGRGRK